MQRTDDWDGPTLRDRRAHQRLTRAQVARRIRQLPRDELGFTPPDAHPESIRKHETGQTRPGLHYRICYCAVLDATPAELGFHDPETNAAAPATTAVPAAVEAPIRASDGERVPSVASAESSGPWAPYRPAMEVVRMATEMDRRQLAALSGLALVAAAGDWLTAEPSRLAAALNGSRIDTTLAAGLDAGLVNLRRIDDLFGGSRLYEPAIAHTRLVASLLRDGSYTETVGRDLYAVAAESTRLAAWAASDNGDVPRAQHLYLHALQLAHHAGQPALGANVLRCMAVQARVSGDFSTAIRLLLHARTGARGSLTAIEEAFLAAMLASAYVRVGDSESTLAEVDRAHTHIAQVGNEDKPAYVYWLGPDEINYEAGKALIPVDPTSAVRTLSTALESEHARNHPRSRALRSIQLALAHARADDAEQAVDIGHRSIDLAASVTSTWATASVWRLCREVDAAGHHGASELADHARTALPSVYV